MTDNPKDEDKKETAAQKDAPEKQEKTGKWSTSAKVGAAVGSAAVAAALIYAGRHQMRRMDEFKSAKPQRGYEDEPELDEDEE